MGHRIQSGSLIRSIIWSQSEWPTSEKLLEAKTREFPNHTWEELELYEREKGNGKELILTFANP